MKLDLKRIEEIYGKSSIYEFKENMDEVITNLNYLLSRGFNNVYTILENNPYIFFLDTNIFEERVNNLIDKLGVEYIEKLEEDFTLWGEIDD